MNENLKSQLQAAIERILTDDVSSQNQLAAQIGISPATIIAVRKGDWQSVSAKMLNRLRAFFNIDSWQIRSTTNFQKITSACKDAADNRRMIAIAGYSGAGKTTALRHYARSNAESFYMLGTVLMTKKSFMKSLQQSLGLQEASNIQEAMDSVVGRLNQCNTGLLIIDDAGKLSETILRLIQVIYDRTEYQAGIVLAGTEYLKQVIDKNASRNKNGFRELKRRIAFWQPMYRPTASIIETICKDYDITSEHSIRYIFENTHDYGTLRNLIQNAIQARDIKNIDIDREVLESLSVGDHFYTVANN